MTNAGSIKAVCTGPGGLPNHVVEAARVTRDGLEGDAQRHDLHGGMNRAVCLFAVEDIRALAALGVRPLAPGELGENLLTEGLDYQALTPGDHLRVGEEVVLEVHDVREPCIQLKPIDSRFPELMVGRSGFVCRVLQEGEVRTGQTIRCDSKS